ARVELGVEGGERAEAEAAQRVVEVGRLHPTPLLRRRLPPSFLTARAPIGGARVVALTEGADRRAAARAGAAGTPVHLPQRSRPAETGAHHPVRRLERRPQLGVGDLRELPPGREPRLPEALG